MACEFSGIVRDAFAARGHEAWSCDLLPSERPGPHLPCDALSVLDQGWDLIIAHPECRYLNHAGVRWLYEGGRRWNKDGSENPRDPERWAAMESAAEFFNKILDVPCPLIAAENSETHPYAVELVGRKADQVIQPWQFGHGEVKATHLWLKNLPLLTATNIVEGRKPRVHHESPGPDRWKNRSRTMAGVASAMAEQWGHSPQVNQPGARGRNG